MDFRARTDAARRRIEENHRARHISNNERPLAHDNSWRQYRTATYRSGVSSQIDDFQTRYSLFTDRATSPGLRYRAELELFYQKCGGKERGGSPVLMNYSGMLATGFTRVRNELNSSHSTSLLKRRLNDVLKPEDLLKAQQVLEEMTPEDAAKLPPRYIATLSATMELLQKRLPHS